MLLGIEFVDLSSVVANCEDALRPLVVESWHLVHINSPWQVHGLSDLISDGIENVGVRSPAFLLSTKDQNAGLIPLNDSWPGPCWENILIDFNELPLLLL